jgi:hypothetical protein
MRKFLLSTSALAGAALISSAAVADVSIVGEAEFAYATVDHNQANQDGNTMSSVQEVHVNFTNKTDSGLTISANNQFNTVGGGQDDVSFSIAGGFGKLVFGKTNGVGASYEMDPLSLIAEEAAGALNSGGTSAAAATTTASISTNTGAATTNGAAKVSYHLPAMGGLTAGITMDHSGTISGSDDAQQFGMRYSLDAGGSAITLGYASTTKEVADVADTDVTSTGIKIVNGDISFMAAQGDYQGNDEDRSTQSASISYKMANGLTVGYGTVASEDDLDTGEEYTANHFEAQYSIASGLTAVVTVSDFDYKVTGAQHENGASMVNMNGSTTKLTIKAAFS